jgi:hypothetical protein
MVMLLIVKKKTAGGIRRGGHITCIALPQKFFGARTDVAATMPSSHLADVFVGK